MRPRRSAIWAGRSRGRHGSALEEAARDEDGGVRSQAILALGTIGCTTPTSVKVVLTGFQDADPLVRAAAVVSVGRWGEPNEAILSGLAPLAGGRKRPGQGRGNQGADQAGRRHAGSD